MKAISRRGFLGSGAVCAALGLSAATGATTRASQVEAAKTVHFLTDGPMLTPLEYSELLVQLCKGRGIKPDGYLSGGSVAKMETAFAKVLGKESAVFVPTGTLANHLALRVLSEGKSRALVQAESHIYNDSLDCVQTLSNMNLVPLADGRATFTVQEVQEAVRRAADGPFPLQVGAIAIECPVRRMNGQAFDHEEMKRIATFAKEKNIRLHLDGARLFIASAYTGIEPADYASLFDTVYISLYKYFGAATGAVLAGPRSVIEKVAHGRKLFGSGLLHAWPYTAVALHSLDGFLDRYRRAVASAETLFAALGRHEGFRVEKFPGGTNICRLHIPTTDAARYRKNLQERGILVRPPRESSIPLTINESINHLPAQEIASRFVEALPAK